MRYYLGTFTDIDKHPYYVTMTTSGSGQVFLNFVNETPFETEMDTSGDILYEPIKRQSGTLHILTDNLSDYKFDLYSPTAKNTKVIINNEDSKRVFAGYVTPSMYDIAFTHEREELDIDLIDGLSILQYYKYTPIGETRGNHSMLEIIMKCLNECEVYSGLYLAKNLHLASGDTSEPLSHLVINEQTFFPDEDEYDTDGNRITDDDDTMLEVLEKIMRYLGMTMVAEGDEVYILDYDGIRHRQHNSLPYWHWSELSASATPTTVDLAVEYGDNYYYEISGNSYADADQSLSLDKVYNKVTVVDSFNTIDAVIPSLLGDESLSDRYPTCNDPYNPAQYNQINLTKGDNDRAFYSFHSNPNYIFHYYDENNNEVDFAQSLMTKPTGWSEENVAKNECVPMSVRGNYRGATIVKWHSWKSEDYPDGYDAATLARMPYFKPTNYLLLQHGNLTPYYGHPAVPLVEMTPNTSFNFMAGGAGLYIIINGTATVFDLENQFGYLDNWSRKEDWFRWYVPLKLKLSYAGQWWSGTQWQSQETTFDIRMIGENNDHWIGKELKIVNTVPWYNNMKKEGWMIPLPLAELTDESPRLIIMSQNQPETVGDRDYRIDQIWIKDFKVEFDTYNSNNSENEDDDTVYTNVINVDHVEQLDEIDMDICTFDSKHISYNTVSLVSGNNYTYLDTVYHDTLTDDLDSGYSGTARLEEYLCVKVAKQYQKPRRRLSVTLNTLLPVTELVYEHNLDAWFVIDSINKDFAMKSYTYNLIEKV